MSAAHIYEWSSTSSPCLNNILLLLYILAVGGPTIHEYRLAIPVTTTLLTSEGISLLTVSTWYYLLLHVMTHIIYIKALVLS